MDPADTWLAWQKWLSGAGAAPESEGLAGLAAAANTYTRFAQDLAGFAARRGGVNTPGDAERVVGELGALAQRFFAGALPPGPPTAAPGARWAEATATLSRLLAEIARATGARYAARLAAPEPPATLRAAFDAWIDCAEAAFQHAAHSDAYASAQATLLNEYVAARAAQQALLERGAQLAGMPTRAELDALHDAVRQLRRELAGRSAAPDQPPPVRRRQARKRSPR